MAGISVPQYDIFKIGTDKLKYYNWDLYITKKDALKYQELVSLFESQAFRMIAQKIIKDFPENIDYSKVFCQIVINKKVDFARATNAKGIKINGETYRRFLGTNGGLKNNTLVFCNVKYIDQLNELCECSRDKSVKLVPAKFESYKALTCSASQPICEPNGIIVVKDAMTCFNADVIELGSCDITTPTIKYVKNKFFDDVNASDGFNLCTIGYMQRVAESLGVDYVPTGVCLRNAWTKGMLYPFPILEFVEKYNNGCYLVEDVWGNIKDLRECEMILTESSLKLWKAYRNVEDYIESYRSNGYCFSVTKISSPHLDEQRELNYQYLQSYEFTDEDIAELCEPTIKYLRNSMGGDYSSAIEFLGITQFADINSWQAALFANEYMLGDPYIVDSIHRFIKKKVNDSKIGKIIVDGNYQLASGDPFTLMQSICGLKITGLLKAGEVYSKFWINKNEEDLVLFRSPMTSHNNIRKCNVNSTDDAQYWYQYMSSIMIINSFDSFCMAENGCDYDGDLIFSTNNAVLKRKYRPLPAIECAQNTCEKIVITEKEIKKTNKNGMGNKVGTITNRVTSMMEVQSRFEKGTPEWDELDYRITCGQTYQQNEIDKIKGIVATPMPNEWYNIGACGDNVFLQSICADKKPYFFIYVYDHVKTSYRKYIKENECKCKKTFGCSIEELYNKNNRTEDENDFLWWYEYKFPVGMGDCAMNRICRYMEQQLDGYKSKLKENSNFDYTRLKVKRRCTEEHRQKLKELEQYYCECVRKYIEIKKSENSTEKNDNTFNRQNMVKNFKMFAKEICENDDERMNIILDITYAYNGNRQFCWDTVGDLIVGRLRSDEFNALYTE